MNSARSDFLHVARERGYIHQTTEEGAFLARLQGGPLAGYIGFDATADSLHVGSLVQIMLLRLMQQTGNRPVVLMGGGTTKVGDPSFRDEARPLLSDAQIEINKAGIRKVFDSFLTFGSGPTDAIMLDNAEWLDKLLYIPFLRDVGRHFSVNRMLTMESVKQRLERDQPFSFLEFNYMLLQAYDFLELRRRHGVVLQMGGSDQWGNIVMGTDLIRRMDQAEAFGLTTPLITTASGAKMGKTAQGAVWLNADRVSPYDYWQFWRNTEDADVARFMGLFTELPMTEIARYAALQGSEVNEAKKALATAACALLHGREAAEAAAEGAENPAPPAEEQTDEYADYAHLADRGHHPGHDYDPQPSTLAPARRLKLSAVQRLILLLLHSPELGAELAQLGDLDSLDAMVDFHHQVGKSSAITLWLRPTPVTCGMW